MCVRPLLAGWLFFVASAAIGEPLATWANFDGGSEEAAKFRALARGCVPDSRAIDFGIPPNANIVYVEWSGTRPECDVDGDVSSDPIRSIVLLSHMPVKEVVSWYRTALKGSGYFEYTLPPGPDEPCSGKHVWEAEVVIFLRSKVPSFCWNRDAYSAMTIVITSSVNEFEAYGYETSIEIYSPAL